MPPALNILRGWLAVDVGKVAPTGWRGGKAHPEVCFPGGGGLERSARARPPWQSPRCRSCARGWRTGLPGWIAARLKARTLKPSKHVRPPSTLAPQALAPQALALQAHWRSKHTGPQHFGAPALRGPSTLRPRQAPTGPVPHPCNDIFSPARVPGGPVAQRIEQRASNAKVAGSSPAGTAMPHLIDLRPGAAARRANVEQRLWVPQNCWRSVSACESRRRQRGRRS